MATRDIRSEPPLIVIVGPTASGKTDLAVRIAKDFDGEVISADSRAIYSGLDIGTAKPTRDEQQGVPHWGFDLVAPGDRFTVADFQQYAVAKIADIRARGRAPIMIGGTGLYIDAVVYEYEFTAPTNDLKQRDELEKQSLEALQKYCIENNITLPYNDKNKRHVIGAIMRNGHANKRKNTIDDNTTIVGITTEKALLQERIAARSEKIFSPAMIDEASKAGERYGWDNEAMTGNIYPLLHRYIDGEMTIEQAKETFRTLDWQLAKRQLTWLRRNSDIHWVPLDDAYRYIAQVLVTKSKK